MLGRLLRRALIHMRRQASLARRLLRVTLLSLVVLALLCHALLSVGAARVDDALLDLGRHLSALGELGGGGEGRRVLMNGQAIGFRVTASPLPVPRVLDHYEAWCRRGGRAFLDPPAAVRVAPPSDWRDLTLRGGEGGRGYVGCIVRGHRRRSAGELLGQVEAFVDSGSLAELGRFHYVFAEPADRGTRVIAVWTDGDFHPGKLFPLSGDAPGGDVPGIPRPPSGRRILSVGEVGHPQTLTVYSDGADELDELVAFYRRSMSAKGWRVRFDAPGGPGVHGFVVERRGRLRVVTVGVDPSSGSYVAIAVAN